MENKEEKKGSISMVEANLPPGFRFYPRDDELICDYLMRRTVRSLYQPVVLIAVDLNKCEPWEIPRKSFFSFLYLFNLLIDPFIISRQNIYEAFFFSVKTYMKLLCAFTQSLYLINHIV